MLEKLAKQTAVYGISTIVVRFLSYLLTPYYTRIFGQETYGIVTDIYALIPLALTLLTMGMESSYFRFSAKAEEAGLTVKGLRSGRQTQAFRHDVGRYIARRRGVLRACRFVPQRRRRTDGRGLCRTSRICGLGGAYHPLRRLGLHPLLAAARAGTGAAVRRHQGAERGDERSAGRRFRRRRAFRYGIRRRLGLRRQPDRQRRDVAGHPRHRGPHRAQDQLGAAGRGLRLFAAAAGRRTGGHGQRIHRPAADQIPRARRSHGAGRYLRRHYEDRRGDDALLPDVPAFLPPSRSSCRISRSRISCR